MQGNSKDSCRLKICGNVADVTRLFSALTALLCLCLLSCIEGKEEVWVEADGSSRIEMEYILPVAARRQIVGSFQHLKKIADEIDGANLEEPSVEYIEGNQIRLFAKMSFDDPFAGRDFQERLLASESGNAKPSTAGALVGRMDAKFDSGAASLKRTIFTSSLFPLKNTTPSVAERNRKILKGAKLDYVVHLPNAPLSSNAMSTDDEGKTLKWSFLLADYLDKDPTLEMLWRPKIPWWLWLSAGLILTLTIFVAWKFLRFLWRRAT